MQVFHHINTLREALDTERKKGASIAMVPTMGNLHAAHLALVETAKRTCDIVVATIFVNRMQFGLNEDWDKYPRTLAEDTQKLQGVGCDFLFCPTEQEIYPNGMDAQTRVIVPSMADILCGASRPGHFEGVTTVVTKLFNIVQPDTAIFGVKDYQQLAIIRRMTADLCLPIRIVAGDIVRESDGLAMSSRNGFITAKERPRANRLHVSLLWVRDQIAAGQRNYIELQNRAKQQIEAAGFKPDYITISECRSLLPAAHDDKELTILGAMYTAHARLIDNVSLVLEESTLSIKPGAKPASSAELVV